MVSVAVIGGGITGLTIALKFIQSGYNVDIYEASSDLGGLAGDFEIQGTTLEKTYHHIFWSDKYARSLVTELGINEKLKWYASSIGVYFNGEFYPFVTPLDLLRFKPLSLLARVRTGLVTFYLQKFNMPASFETSLAKDWMLRIGGAEAYKVIWGPLLEGKFGDLSSSVSMAWLWSRLHIRGNSKQSVLAKEKLGYFDGGVGTLWRALKSQIDTSGRASWYVGESVTRIERNNDLNKVVVQTLRGAKNYDGVLSTIPSSSLANVVQSESSYQDKLREVDYLGAICMVFSSEQNLGNYYWNNINDRSFPFLIFVNHTKLVGTTPYNGKNVYYLGGYFPHNHRYFEISDQDLSKEWFSGLKRLFPDFALEKTSDLQIFRLKYAQHIASTNYRSKIVDQESPVKGLFVSNFSQIYPEDRGVNYAIREAGAVAKVCKDYLESLNIS